MNALDQVIRCATAQQTDGKLVSTLVACEDCGGDAPAVFRGGPPICATCRIKREVAA